jgi:uncharacterized membrane protein YgcG
MQPETSTHLFYLQAGKKNMNRILKIILILSLGLLVSCGGGESKYDPNTSVPKGDPSFPKLENSWVIDRVGVLSQPVITQGDAICQKLREDGIAEVVVVLIDSVKHPEDWATHYGRWLGLGSKGMSTEGGNNGLVWLIRPDAAEKLTISVGRGLPQFATADYGPIIDGAVEYLNFNNYDNGVMNLVTETDRVLRKIYGGKSK